MYDSLEDELAPAPAAADLVAACESAARVNSDAQQALSCGQWAPRGAEQAVARDFSLALARQPRPHVDWPWPGADAVLWRVLKESSCWAPMIRLAMRAGGWPVQEPPSEGLPRLPALLTAFYRPAMMLYRWNLESPDRGHARTSDGKTVTTDAEYDALLKERVPAVADGLAAADRVLTRGLGMTLLVAGGLGQTWA